MGASFEIPESTCEFTAMGTLRFLEILRDCDPLPKFVHASSSEIFGEPDEAPQNEDTPMRPMTPYGVAKAFTTQMVRGYREKLQHDLLQPRIPQAWRVVCILQEHAYVLENPGPPPQGNQVVSIERFLEAWHS